MALYNILINQSCRKCRRSISINYYIKRESRCRIYSITQRNSYCICS